MRLALIYDMDACRGPTGVTRHALAQIRGLRDRPGVALTLVSGRITQPDGRIAWDDLDPLPRRELPIRTRDALRVWRAIDRPPLTWWTGPVDWVYAPAEYYVSRGKARLAVTSHDVLQDLTLGGPRRKALLAKVFARADRVLSVSRFNADRLAEAFPTETAGKVALVPNAADDLFFEPAAAADLASTRADLGLPPGMPYLLSVANLQPRKNLARFARAAARLDEVARGELALVFVGEGSPDEARSLREAATEVAPRSVVKLAGYRQGRALRAAYDGATALVFPSTCESFGIPAVEAMARGTPAVLADSTALPEVAGPAGWYFPPLDEPALTATLRALLDSPAERARRASLGRTVASTSRWSTSTDLLLASLHA